MQAGWLYLAMPVGIAAMLLVAIEILLKAARHLMDPGYPLLAAVFRQHHAVHRRHVPRCRVGDPDPRAYPRPGHDVDGHASMGAMWMMNNDVFEAMSPDERKIVEDGFDALRWTTIVFPNRRSIEAYQAFKDAGGEICVPTADEKARFVAAAAPIYDWYQGKYGSEWLDVPEGSIADCETAIQATRGRR